MPPLFSIIVWDPAIPPPAILLLGALLAMVAVHLIWFRTPLSKARRFLLLTLRLSVIFFVCLLLFHPQSEESIPQRHPRRVAMVAVDSSQSMLEPDARAGATRIDEAKRLILRHELHGTSSPLGEVRTFAFADHWNPITTTTLATLRADGETTNFHTSLSTIFSHVRKDEHCVGLFVLTDGHDFENVPAARTAAIARANRIPIYPIPLGKVEIYADLGVRMASYQSSTYVKQVAKLQATIRSVATSTETVRAELLRENTVLRFQQVKVNADNEATVSFDVSEENPGQYEYAIRVSALPGERNIENNQAITYLNVTASKVRVLLIEGSPHWDTAFIQRSLARNERIEMDSMIALGTNDVRISRPEGAKGEFVHPKTIQDFTAYSIVMLGKKVERILDEKTIEELVKAVEEHRLTLIMARGKPGESKLLQQIAPADWLATSTGPVDVTPSPKRSDLLPVDVLQSAPGGVENLPILPILHQVDKPKTLVTVETIAGEAGAPAMLHRRQGNGQVLAIAVEGLWKWGLNARSDHMNNVFHRFWNQLLINLLARSNAVPTNVASLTLPSANVAVGEKVIFDVQPAKGEKLPGNLQAVVYRDDQKIADVPMNIGKENTSATASYVIEKLGRYRAEVSLGNEKLHGRFSAYREQGERTDPAPNLPYLRSLAEATGGRVLDEISLPKTLESLALAAAAESSAPPLLKRTSLWDNYSMFLILAGLFGSEWFLRRRWGLT